MLLDIDKTTNHCKEFEQFRREQLTIITQIQLRLAEATSKKEPVMMEPTATARPTFKSLEMEKSKAPTFSGKNLRFS